MSWFVSSQSEYREGTVTAVPTRIPCSDDLVGLACQSGFAGLTATSAAVFGCGSGTSKTWANRSAFSSKRVTACADDGAAPTDCCRRDGFGAIAAAPSVLAMRAQR